MRKLAVLLMVTSLLVACGLSPGTVYLNSTEREKRLAKLYKSTWQKTAQAFLNRSKFLEGVETFPLTATADVGISGWEVCNQARKENKSITPGAHFILACSKNSHHSVVFRAKDGKATLDEGPWPVMFHDGTLFRGEAGVLIVSMSSSGASARTSDRRLSPDQLQELDTKLVKRWEEGYRLYFKENLPN